MATDWTDWTSYLPLAVGGILGSQSGSKQTGTSTTTVNPYAPAQPHINAALEQAAKLYQQQASMPDWLQGIYNQGLGTYNAVQGMQIPTMQNLGIGQGNNGFDMKAILPLLSKKMGA